jgi:transcriptional regulator with XRE-family HTH domain
VDTQDPKINTERFRLRRLELKLTQEELAERSGINQSTVSQLERGEQAPSLRSLIALAQALGVSIEWLLGFDNPNEAARILDDYEQAIVLLYRRVDPSRRAELARIVEAIVAFGS